MTNEQTPQDANEATIGAVALDRRVGHQAFIGREYFDSKTMMWTFRDGSGAVPEEMRQDMYDACDRKNAMGCNGISVLGTLFAWKRRLMPNV